VEDAFDAADVVDGLAVGALARLFFSVDFHSWPRLSREMQRVEELKMDLSIVDKHSSGGLGIVAVVFSFLGGMEVERGVDGIVHGRYEYYWIGSFLIGAAFLGMGIFYVVMLAKRAPRQN